MAEVARLPVSRQTIRDQVVRHPMIAFVALAYAISCAWLLDYRIDLGTVNGFGIIGSISPALSAMIVSAQLRPEPSGFPEGRRRRLFAVFGVLALAVMTVVRLWAAAGLVTVPGVVETGVAYPVLTAFLVDVLAAAAVAFVLSGINSPRQGVRDLLHSLNPHGQPVRLYWFAIAAGSYPVVFAAGNALSAGLGLPGPAPKATGPWYWLASTALVMFVYYLFAGGGLEEPGWRGMALPWLQRRFGPLRSSLALGVIWTFWHWPHMWLALPEAGPLVVISFLMSVVPLAILFTAVFNRTRGSLLIAILLHASINTTDLFLPASVLTTVLWLLLMLGLGLWMWWSPQTFSYHEAQ